MIRLTEWLPNAYATGSAQAASYPIAAPSGLTPTGIVTTLRCEDDGVARTTAAATASPRAHAADRVAGATRAHSRDIRVSSVSSGTLA